jgi:glycosyltransferase involved in cell wall biosynthesis
MNILLVNHYAGSPVHGMEYRPHYMARSWNAAGHRTRIVAAAFSHLRSRQPERASEIRIEHVGGVEYVWLPAGPYEGNGLGRIRNMVSFVSGLFRHAGRLTDGFEPGAVISSSTYPLDAIPASRLARRHGARYVHEVHDLWPLSPMELGGMSPWHPFIVIMQAAENYAYRKADRVISMLPKAEAHMLEHGLEPGKFVYVPNGIDRREWESAREPLPDDAVVQLGEFRARWPFLVGYAGAHGLANSLETFVETAPLLASSGVGLVLVGQGPEKSSLRRLAERRGDANILFLEPVKKACIPALLEGFDALYIGWRRHPLYRFGVSPNKLMDYMMAAKPVIHAIEAGNDIVQDARCGLSVEPERPHAVADAIRVLAGKSPAERAEIGSRGRSYVLRHHTYDVLSSRFLEALQ